MDTHSTFFKGWLCLWIGLIGFHYGSSAASQPHVDLAALEPVVLERVGRLQHSAIDESSGLVLSRQWPGVLWTHNDSGDAARIFAVDMQGLSIFPNYVSDSSYAGLHIGDAVNVDWEDIAADEHGNLYIAACGNNANLRRDLGIYQVREPHPESAILTRTHQYFRFEWPDQHDFPPSQRNFDCEALFWANGHLYLLTKHRSDTATKLYRMDTLDPVGLNVPTLIAQFDIAGQVTAADATPDGRRLAILTYDHVWVFDLDEAPTRLSQHTWFEGSIRCVKMEREQIRQCEGITFLDSETLLISNEQRDLFRLELAQMTALAR